MLIRRLPDEESRIKFIDCIIILVNFYEADITLSQIGFPESYVKILKQFKESR